MSSLAFASNSKTLIEYTILILIFTTGALSGPTGYRGDGSSCVSYCKESHKFNYETGTTYVYDYKTDIKTSLLEGSLQGSHIYLSTKVELESVSSCEFKLKLAEVTISEKDSEFDKSQSQEQNAHFIKIELEKHTLRFAFQDGKVEYLCSNPDEPVWVTNIKRGILSMLHNTVEDINVESTVQETDVNGKCRTQYKPSASSWGGAVTLTKSKDLSTCIHRQTYVSPFQSVPYSAQNKVQGMTLITGDVKCNQIIRNNKFEKVQCFEQQKFKPFEDNRSGAKSQIYQNLEYASSYLTKNSEKDGSGIKKRNSLMFEVDKESVHMHRDVNGAVELLQKMKRASDPSVKAEAPVLFVELVEYLRQVDEVGLQSLLIKSTEIQAMKILLNAIPLVNSDASLPIMRNLYLQGQINDDQFNSWLSSLAFIKDPSTLMIEALLPLLEGVPKPQVLLSISALINSYCKNSVDCSHDPLVIQALEILSAPLGTFCEDMEPIKDSRRTILSLKAIGNIGIDLKSLNKSVIEMCFLQKSNSVEIRLSAIESYRRTPCSSFSADPFLKIYSTLDENTEIRISSYLIAMKCASSKTIETVKNILQTEEVNQVGSFVWTHLTNLQETNRVDKQEIKGLVSNEILKNKFKTDVRKFSRNFESSMFSNDWNAGAGLDSNIIFTEESFLPRSGMLNLTVQMFGESINLLEFGGRVQAPETLMEPLFGPNGYFPDDSVTDFLKSARSKRDVGDNEIERLSEVYDSSTKRIEKTPTGSFYARIFGHEILYKDFKVNTESTIPNFVDETGNSWLNVKSLLENLSTGKKTDFTKSAILMDIIYSTPTSAGIPLSLGLKTSATIGLSAEGKFNVGKFIENKELEIYGYLRPNTAIDVDASLSTRIGARNKYLRSGLAVRNILRSSTAIETHLLINGYNLVKMDFNLPQDKQEIFEASSQVMILMANGDSVSLDSALEEATTQASVVCLGDHYGDFWGVRLCGQFESPEELTFPPSSPILAKLYVEKTDQFKGYHVDYNFDNSPAKTKLSVVFDTPGSKTNRRTAVMFTKESKIGQFQATLETPSKSIIAEGTYLELHKNFELTIIDDGNQLLHLNSSLNQRGNKIEPSLFLTVLKKPMAEIIGSIEYPNNNEAKKRGTVELTMKHLTQNPIRINGNLIMDGVTNLATLGIESYYLTGALRSQIKHRSGHISTKSILEYSWMHGPINNVDINAKLQKTQKGALSKFTTSASFSISNFPDQNVDFSWETQTSIGFCENTAKFTIGKSTWEGHTLFSKQISKDQNEIRLQMSFSNIRNEIDYLLEFSHQMMDQSISTKFIGKTSTANEVKVNFDYDSLSRPFLKKNVTAQASWPGSEYSFEAALQEKRKGEFEGELLISLNKLKEMKGTITYINNSNNLKLDHVLDFRARGFSAVPISGSLAFSATDKQSHIGCQVQFEGRKPNNSRLSSSIDYSHSRNIHKIEAKVTINEKKYNGEVTYAHDKSATKHLTVDLNLDNHIYMDAKIAGMYPESMMGSFYLIPDKENDPQDKLEVKGTLDSQNAGLYLNYFGEKVSVNGGYGNGMVAGEAVWSEDQRLALTVLFPIMEWNQSSLNLEIVLPIDGYRNISGNWDHSLEDGNWESNICGNVEDKYVSSGLNVSFNVSNIKLNAVGEATGYPRLEAAFVLINEEGSKQLELALKKGDQDAVLTTQYLNLPQASVLKLDLRGCKFLPEILIEWNQQFQSRHISTFQAAWAMPQSTRSVVHLELEKRFSPLSYKFSIASPWENWKSMIGTLTLDKLSSSYTLDITNNGQLDLIPLMVSVGIQGTRGNFEHHGTVNWRSKELKMSMQGALVDLSNTDFTIEFKYPKHNYNIQIKSQMNQENYRAGINGEFNGEKGEIGLTLNTSLEKDEIRVWGNLPSQINKSVILTYEKSNDLKKLLIDVQNEEKSLVKFLGEFSFDSQKIWNIQTKVESSSGYIPSLDFKSIQKSIDESEMKHQSSLKFSPSDGSFWSIISVKDIGLQFTIKNHEDITGTASWDDKNLSLQGNLQETSQGHNLAMKITSTEFHDVYIEGSYQFSEEVVSFGTSLNYNAKSLFKGEISGNKLSDAYYSSTLFLSSVYSPTLDGEISADTERGLFQVFLKQDEVYVIHANGSAQAQLTKGSMSLGMRSGLFSSIDNIFTEGNYQIDSGSFDFGGKYVSSFYNYQIKSDGIWQEDDKSLRLSSQGDFVGSLEILMEQWNKVTAFVTRNEKKIGEINLEYEAHMGEFSWGKHAVHMTYIDSERNPTAITVSLGVDTKSLDLEVKTPFPSWKQIRVYGKLDLQSAVSKSLKFGLQKENDKVQSGFEMKNFKRNGSSFISTEVIVVGFTKIRKILLDSVNITSLGLNIPVEQPIRLGSIVRWSSASLEFEVDTPVEQWKRFQIGGNWELNKNQKHIGLKGDLNGYAFEVRGGGKIGAKQGELQFYFQTDKIYKAEVKYELGKLREIKWTLTIPEAKRKLDGKIRVTDNSLLAEVDTPFIGFENVMGKAIYSNISETHQKLGLEWALNKLSRAVNLEIINESGDLTIKLQTPIQIWDNVTISLKYNDPLSNINFNALRGDGKQISVAIDNQKVGNILSNSNPASAIINIKIETPFQGYEESNLGLNYERKEDSEYKLSLRGNKMSELEGQLELMYKGQNPLSASISARVAAAGPKNIESKVQGTLFIDPSGKITFSARTESNGMKHEIDTLVESSSAIKIFNARTTLPFLKRLRLSFDFTKDAYFHGLWEGNGDRAEIQGTSALKGLTEANLNVSLSSTITGLKNIQINLDQQINPGMVSSVLSFQNERSRWLSKFEGTYDENYNGEWSAHLNSPIKEYRDLTFVLEKSWNVDTKQIKCSMGRNLLNIFEVDGSLKQSGCQLVIKSNIFELPIHSETFVQWGQEVNTLQMTLNAGDEEYKSNIELNIQGISSGLVNFKTTMLPNADSRFAWKLEGSIAEGSAWASLTNDAIGNKSVRSQWRADTWKQLKGEVWLRTDEDTDETRGSVQFNIQSDPNGNKRCHFQMTYAEDSASNGVSAFVLVKQTGSNYDAEIRFNTPLKALKKFQVIGNLRLDSPIVFEIKAIHNNGKAEANAELSNIKSSFEINFNVPEICKPFEMQANYDLLSDTKVTDIHFKQGIYEVKLKNHIFLPRRSKEVEIDLSLSSTVPFAQMTLEGNLKGSYHLHSNGISEVIINMESNSVGKWRLLGALRPTSDFHLKVKLESGAPELIPNIVFETNFRGNYRQGISSDLLFIHSDSQYKLIVSVSTYKFNITWSCPLESFQDISIEGNLQLEKQHKEIEVKLNMNGETFTLSSSCDFIGGKSSGNGKVVITRGKQNEGIGSLVFKLDENGKLELMGNWGQREIKIQGHAKGTNNELWAKSGITELSLSFDGLEPIAINSAHHFRPNDYSFNITAGSNKVFKVYFSKGSSSLISSTLQWDEDWRIKLKAEFKSDRFEVSLSNPWTADTVIQGLLQTNQTKTIVNGYLVYDNIKSSIKLKIESNKDTSNFEISLDIPTLHQKLDTTISVFSSGKHRSLGKVEMMLNGRPLGLTCQFFSKLIRQSATNTKKESKLSLTLILPSQEVPQILTELTLTRPLSHLGNIEITGRVLIKEEVSTFSFSFDLPMHDNKQLGIKASCHSTLFSWKRYEIFLSSNGPTFKNFDGYVYYNQNEVSLQWNVDLPEITGTFKVLAASSKYGLNEYSISTRGLIDMKKMLNISIEAVCKEKTFKFHSVTHYERNFFTTDVTVIAPEILGIPHRYIIELNELELRKQYELVATGQQGNDKVHFTGELLIYSSMNITGHGKVTGSYGSHDGKLLLKSEREKLTADLQLESTSLLVGKKMRVIGEIGWDNNMNFFGNLQCQTSKAIHKTSIIGVLATDAGIITINAESPQISPILLSGEWTSKEGKFLASIKANYQSVNNSVDGILDTENLEGRLTIDSPLIPSSHFNVHLKCKNIIRLEKVDLLGDIYIRNVHWRVEGVMHYENLRNMKTKLEIMTPYKSMDKLTLGAKSTEDEMYIEIHTPIEIIPNAMVKISGIEGIKKRTWTNMQPSITIGLPFGRYSISGMIKAPSKTETGTLGLFFEDGVSIPSKTYEFFSKVSPLGNFNSNMGDISGLHIRLVTPIQVLRIFEIEAKGKINGKNLIELYSKGSLNEDTMETNFGYINNDGRPKVNLEISTPFEHYETIKFQISSDSFNAIGTGRSVHMDLEMPDWDDKMEFNADYRYSYEGMLDIEGEINAVLISFMEIPPLHLNLKTGTQQSNFTGVLIGNLGSQNIGLKIETLMQETGLSASLDGKLGEDEPYHVNAKLNFHREENEIILLKEVKFQNQNVFFVYAKFSPEMEVAGGEIKLSTPWGILETNLALMPISPFIGESLISAQQFLDSTNFTFHLAFDKSRIIGIQIVTKEGHTVVEIYNPIQPVSIMLNLENVSENKVKVIGKFCWDINKPVGNTVGITFDKDDRARNYRVQIHAAKVGMVEVELAHTMTSFKVNSSFSLEWSSPLFNTQGKTGYALVLSKSSSLNYESYDCFAQVDLPWRSLILETFTNRSIKESQNSFFFKWDAKKDHSKFISMKTHEEMKMTWRVIEASRYLEIKYPLSIQPLIVSIDQIYKDNRFQHIEVDVKSSQNPESNFMFLISRNKTDWQNFRIMARHSPTNLYTELSVKTSDENLSVNLAYMDLHGITREIELQGSLLPGEFSVGIYTGNESNRVEFFNLETQFIEDPILLNIRLLSTDAQVKVQQSLPYFETLINHNGESKIKLSGGFIHKKEFGLQMSKTELDSIMNYVLVTLKLNSSNTISARVKWDPDSFTDLPKIDLLKNLNPTIYDVNIDEITRIVTSEIEGRWKSVSPEIISGLESIQNIFIYESKLIYQEWVNAIDYLNEVYNSNTFYIQDICKFLSLPVETIKKISRSLVNELTNFGKLFKEVGEQTLLWCREICNKYEGKLEKAVMDMWDQLEALVNHIWRENLAWVSTTFDMLEELVETFVDSLEGRIEEIEKKLMAVGMIRKMFQVYKDYATWIEEIPIHDYVENVENILTVRIWDKMAECLQPLLDAIQNGVEGQYFLELLETPPLPYIRHIVKNLDKAFEKFWEAIEIEQRIKNLLRASLKNVDGLVHRYIPAGSFNYDLNNGFIEYDQSLSAIQWKDFTQLPQWKISEEDTQDVNQLTNFYYQVLDKIESLKPLLNMNIRNLLPPFGSYALMAGDHHYFTFDRKYFRFSGECSYLLVGDMHTNDDAFSLIANYENRDGTARKKSYTLVTGDKIIDIDISNFRVTVGNKKVELPIEVGSVLIRRHQTGLEVFDKRGFQMSCSLSPSVCTVWTSGWHFGKVAGLLGTYDNEQINDLRNPEGQTISDVTTFAYSWRVGKNSGICRMKNFAKEDFEPYDIDEVCHNLLTNRSSPLRPCFNTVDTHIYMEMCKYDVSRNINNANRAEAACSSMSAYVAECQKNSVDIWMPPGCVRCRLEDGTALTTGENATLQIDGKRSPPSSSDNVILLEETSCMAASTVGEAIKRLELALNVQGIYNNRYSIVGYGGSGIHEKPHVKTISSRVWSHSTLFKIHNESYTNEKSTTDLYEAIEYASALGFRAGVSKNIIAFTCGSDKCGNPLKYADILTLLVENDIKFHILATRPFSLKANKKVDGADQIFGIDINGVYTSKHAKSDSIEPDTALKRQINVPKDLCTPLAMESNGSRFNVETPSKKVLDVWSRRLAKTSHPSQCQRCECVPDKYGSASLMCHQCVSPSIWQFMKEWVEITKNETEDGDEFPFDMLDHNEFDDFMMT